jgi:hypothetical protein
LNFARHSIVSFFLVVIELPVSSADQIRTQTKTLGKEAGGFVRDLFNFRSEAELHPVKNGWYYLNETFSPHNIHLAAPATEKDFLTIHMIDNPSTGATW